jgi:hypothetical protein
VHSEALPSTLPLPDYHSAIQPYTPQHNRDTSRRHSSRYSSPPPFYPIPDPRAQYIISQAVHQLSCLMTSVPPHTSTQPWPPPQQQQQHDPAYHPPPFMPYQNTPWPLYNPIHHPPHPSYPSSSRSNSPPFTTPRHSHHNSYDPTFSSGTLPPSSPEPPSSSPLRSVAESSTSQARPKSLVRRSKSRGRRVSFRLDGDDGDDAYDSEPPAGPSSSKTAVAGTSQDPGGTQPARRGRGRPPKSSPQPKHVSEHVSGADKGKGKTRVQDEGSQRVQRDSSRDNVGVRSSTLSESSASRRLVRGQTPGPPSRPVPKRPATPANVPTGRSHSVGRHEQSNVSDDRTK